MTGKFAQLEKLAVSKDKEVEYTIDSVEGGPVLKLVPATEVNKPYYNKLLRRMRKNGRMIRTGRITAGILAESREEDREMYPIHVIRGWRRVVNTNGEEVPFSLENCKEFVAALPDWLFDELRNFAAEPTNFLEVDLDAEDTAGNSPPASDGNCDTSETGSA